MAIDANRAISIITLAGSLASFLATTCVLISFIIYRHHMGSFLHVLILELMVFEFANSLNNSTSGIWFLKNGELSVGGLCTINGFIGQLSAQAVDFSILAIAVTTLLTVTRILYIPNAAAARKICTCLAVCIIPLITSLIPTIMGEMEPVGGNWCWISKSRPDLRYGMAHGWRIFVIFTTIAIYIYIWAYLQRHLKSKPKETPCHASWSRKVRSAFPESSKNSGFRVMGDEEAELDAFGSTRKSTNSTISPAVFEERHSLQRQPDKKNGENTKREGGRKATIGRGTRGSELAFSEAIGMDSAKAPRAKRESRTERNSYINGLQTNASEFPMRPGNHDVEVEIKRMMLLNAYPIMYVVLWAPGLVNRLMEASGHKNTKTTIAALQAPTQFVGLANALTYGFNHHLRDRLSDLYVTPAIIRIKKRFGRSPATS